jgi:hypothetical protein
VQHATLSKRWRSSRKNGSGIASAPPSLNGRASGPLTLHTQNDAGARKELADVVDATVRHETEGRALADAVVETQRRVEQAREAEAEAAANATAGALVLAARRIPPEPPIVVPFIASRPRYIPCW